MIKGWLVIRDARFAQVGDKIDLALGLAKAATRHDQYGAVNLVPPGGDPLDGTAHHPDRVQAVIEEIVYAALEEASPPPTG